MAGQQKDTKRVQIASAVVVAITYHKGHTVGLFLQKVKKPHSEERVTSLQREAARRENQRSK